MLHIGVPIRTRKDGFVARRESGRVDIIFFNLEELTNPKAKRLQDQFKATNKKKRIAPNHQHYNPLFFFTLNYMNACTLTKCFSKLYGALPSHDVRGQ